MKRQIELSSRAKFSRYTGKTKRGDLIFYTSLRYEIATALLAGLVREKRIRLADNDKEIRRLVHHYLSENHFL